MWVLVDARDGMSVFELEAETQADAEAEAWGRLDEVDREDCEDLEDYQINLGISQWYHVRELIERKANA